MLKKILAIVLALMMVMSLCACGGSGDTAEPSSEAGLSAPKKDPATDKIVISYIPMSTAMENTPVIEQGMKDAVAVYSNVTINTYDAQFDPNTQITLINEAITQGVDGIIIQCADAAALNNVIAEAEEAGVVVYTMNIGNTAQASAFICNSDYNAGWEAAEYMNEYLGGEGNYIILDCDPAIKETCRMGTGFEDYADDNTNFNLLENVGMVTTVENAYNTMRDLLTKYDDIDFVYCVNDNQGIGAYQAIKEAGRDDEGILIFGYEGQPMALDAIKQGTMFATSYSDPYYEAYAMTNMMIYSIMLGINSSTLGLEFTPSLELHTTIVTADNIDEVIKGTHWDMTSFGY